MHSTALLLILVFKWFCVPKLWFSQYFFVFFLLFFKYNRKARWDLDNCSLSSQVKWGSVKSFFFGEGSEHISQWLLSLPSTRSTSGFMVLYHENLVKFPETIYTKVLGPHSLRPLWASDSPLSPHCTCPTGQI